MNSVKVNSNSTEDLISDDQDLKTRISYTIKNLGNIYERMSITGNAKINEIKDNEKEMKFITDLNNKPNVKEQYEVLENIEGENVFSENENDDASSRASVDIEVKDEIISNEYMLLNINFMEFRIVNLLTLLN